MKNFDIVCSNTKNIYLRELLNSDSETIEDVKKIIVLFEKENMELENWGLFEIPISGNYCFYNWKTEDNVAFANYFFDKNYFSPLYIDKHSNEQVASSIKEAIKLERVRKWYDRF